MKAYVLNAINDLKYCDVQTPDCRPGWAIIKVKAAGICSSDVPRIFQKGTYQFPTIPGHEFSGVVDCVFDKQDDSLIGKRVGVFPLIPCMKCDSCKNHHYETCDNYDYIGSRRNGGFAEFVEVPVWNLVVLPDNVSFVQAAMLEPLAVALHAVSHFSTLRNRKVAVIGTGMIGIAAGQWALYRGASSVTIIGHSSKKGELVSRVPNLKFKYINDDEQYDCVLEAVGTNETIANAITIAKPFGEIVLMGNPISDLNLAQNTYWRVLRKQLCIKGTWNSYYDRNMTNEWQTVLKGLSTKRIVVDPLVTHLFDQDKLIDGLKLMRDKKVSYCKVMTLWNMEGRETL